MKLSITILIISLLSVFNLNGQVNKTDSLVILPKSVAILVLKDIKKVPIQNTLIVEQEILIQNLRIDLTNTQYLLSSYKVLNETTNRKILQKDIIISNYELIKENQEKLIVEHKKKYNNLKRYSIIGGGILLIGIIIN